MKTQTLTVQVSRVYKLESASSLRGYVDVTINDVLAVKGLKIVDGKNGLFVGMPQTQSKDNKWFDTVYPTSKEARASLEEQVLEQFIQA